MNPSHVPFTGNATHSPNSPPVQANPATSGPHQPLYIIENNDQKKAIYRDTQRKHYQIQEEFSGCIEQTEQLSRRVYEGTYQLIKMKFTNSAQAIVEEASQNMAPGYGNEQFNAELQRENQEFQDRMEQEAMERDRALEIKMFSTLVQLDA